MLKLLLGVGLVAGVALFAVGADAQTCAAERGQDAKTLVDQCLEVSPATHPPCNASNACSLIESEVRRGCGMLSGADRPAFCDSY